MTGIVEDRGYDQGPQIWKYEIGRLSISKKIIFLSCKMSVLRNMSEILGGEDSPVLAERRGDSSRI